MPKGGELIDVRPQHRRLRNRGRPGDLARLPPGLSERPVCRRLAQGDAYRLT